MMGSPIDVLMDGVDWEEATSLQPEFSDGLPYVTHSGVLKIGEMELRCYRLDDGRAIFDAEDVNKFFGGLID